MVSKNLKLLTRNVAGKQSFILRLLPLILMDKSLFYSDSDDRNFEWGASIVKSKVATKPIGTAKMMRLSDYILHQVITRRLPDPLDAEVLEKRPSVVMKL